MPSIIKQVVLMSMVPCGIMYQSYVVLGHWPCCSLHIFTSFPHQSQNLPLILIALGLDSMGFVSGMGTMSFTLLASPLNIR